MGFLTLAELRGRDASDLTKAYCALTSRPEDDVLRAAFKAMVHLAETGEANPWWRILRQDIREGRAPTGCLA